MTGVCVFIEHANTRKRDKFIQARWNRQFTSSANGVPVNTQERLAKSTLNHSSQIHTLQTSKDET